MLAASTTLESVEPKRCDNNANGPNAGGNTVSVIDGRRCQGTDVSRCKGPWPTLTVGNEPSNIAIDEATDNTVSVVNGAICNAQVTSGCNQTPATVPVGTGPAGIFADETNHTVYIANFNFGAGPGAVSLLNSATCNGSHLGGCPTTPLATVTVSNGPGDVDVNQTTHTAYVATLSGMSVFDANTCNASTTSDCSNLGTVIVNGGANFEVSIWVAVDEPLHSVYVSNQKDDYLAVIDTNICNGRNLTACATLHPPTIHTGANPQLIALNKSTQTLYVPNGVAVDNQTHTVYVTNFGADASGTVSVINATTCNATRSSGCSSVQALQVPGGNPSGIAINQATNTIYATNLVLGNPFVGNSVYMINGSTRNAIMTALPHDCLHGKKRANHAFARCCLR